MRSSTNLIQFHLGDHSDSVQFKFRFNLDSSTSESVVVRTVSFFSYIALVLALNLLV